MSEKSTETTYTINYDTLTSPVTFDCLTYLACAVGSVRSIGAKYCFNFNVSEFRYITPRDRYTSTENKLFRFRNLIMNSIGLFDDSLSVKVNYEEPLFVEGLNIPHTYSSSNRSIPYNYGSILKVVNAKVNIRTLAAPRAYNLIVNDFLSINGINPAKLITFHPRHASFDSGRDLECELFVPLLRELSIKGFTIVWLDDFDFVIRNKTFSEQGANKFLRIITFPAASLDHCLRVALAERSISNIVVSGGNWALLNLSKAPYLCFGALNNRSHIADRRFWISNGFEVGAPLPWAEKNQEICWIEKHGLTPNVIIDNFSKHLESLGGLKN